MTTNTFRSDSFTDAFAAADPNANERLLGVFLSRLRRLLQHRVERAAALNPEGIRLLNHAIFSTYCDCRTLGGQAIAQGLIQTGLRCALPERTETGVPV